MVTGIFSFRLFTSQLGKKSSLDQIQKHLRDIRHTETEFCQGNTMRWGVAWTFDEKFHWPEQCQSRKAVQVSAADEASHSDRWVFVLLSLQKAQKKESNRTPISIPFDSKYSFNFIKDYLEKTVFNELKVSRFSHLRRRPHTRWNVQHGMRLCIVSPQP